MKRGDKVIVLPNKKIGIIDKVEDGFFFLEGSNRPYMRGQLDYHDLNKAVKPILKDMNIYDEALDDLMFYETGFDNPNKVIKALERAKKVEELLTYQNHYIDSIVIELERVINKIKLSQSEIIEKELEASSHGK